MDFFTTTALVLGLGRCDLDGDWCENPVGSAAIVQNIMETRSERHAIDLRLQHYSQFGNGEPEHGDYGINLMMVEYTYKIKWAR